MRVRTARLWWPAQSGWLAPASPCDYALTDYSAARVTGQMPLPEPGGRTRRGNYAAAG